jgi:hypothetical protein
MRSLLTCFGLLAGAILMTAACRGDVDVRVDVDKSIRHHDRHLLLGTNAGLWYEPDDLAHPDLLRHLKSWSPASFRLPGGTWTNELFWNGNGVRKGKQVDTSRFRDGVWQIDFSGYAPGFRIHGSPGHPSDYHGASDVRSLHRWIRSLGAKAVVSVNAGTGTPEMAAEWVRFADDNDFTVSHWEIGNELDGDWEMGHFLPDGSRMTGELYARRFLEFATAMKAVDPDIRVGGPVSSSIGLAFGEDLVRLAGDQMDFFSFHAYPVEKPGTTLAEAVAQTSQLQEVVGRIRGWFRQYHPDRSTPVEIGLTEWNKKVAEDLETITIANGIWSSAFIGRMMEAGIDFANHWDLFSRTEDGGHGTLLRKQEMVPTGAYWGFWLWSHHMRNELVSVAAGEEGDSLTVFATRDATGISVMLINPDPLEEKRATLRVPGVGAQEARRIDLTRATYSWDPHAKKPLWSAPPQPTPLALEDGKLLAPLKLAPYSVCVVELRTGGDAWIEGPPPQVSETAPAPHLSLPDSAPVDLPVEGLVYYAHPDLPRGAKRAPVTTELTVQGPARLSEEKIRTAESVGQFKLDLTGPGEVTVTARGGGKESSSSFQVHPVRERAQVVWDFSGPAQSWNIRSSFGLRSSEQAAPNQQVAMVELRGALPETDKDLLLHAEPLPESVDRRRIGGVVVRLKSGTNLSSDDANAAIAFILQSDSDHWIPLGRIPFSEISRQWRDIVLKLKTPEDIQAMPKTYALRLQLISKSPVDGEIFIDDLGFLLRGEN